MHAAPKIKMLRNTERRQPYPLSWEEQSRLFRELPKHLADMAHFDHRPGDSVEDNNPALAILHPPTRHDEDRRAQLRDNNLPVPLQVADLGIPATRVHGVAIVAAEMSVPLDRAP